MFYFKENTAELKDTLYTSSRALGRRATLRSFPLQPAKGDCWGSCYRLRSQLQTNPTHALLKATQTLCALCSPVWNRWTSVTWFVFSSRYQPGTREKQKELSDWKQQKTHCTCSISPARQTWGSPGEQEETTCRATKHKLLNTYQTTSRENILRWGLYFTPGIRTANRPCMFWKSMGGGLDNVFFWGRSRENVLSQGTALQADNYQFIADLASKRKLKRCEFIHLACFHMLMFC